MLAGAVLACGLAVAAAPGAPLVTTIVTDPLTGVAIDGYDPVTYFTEPRPQPGSADFVHHWGGVPWYFVSAANRDVFMRAPDVYAPRFGGHGAMSLARGYVSDGRPDLYAVEQMKLYLFYSTANREAFLAGVDEAVRKAEVNWQRLGKHLLGPPVTGPEPAPEADPGGEMGADP